jgi:hypothetical protein
VVSGSNQPYAAQFVDAKAQYRTSHTILDFTAGKDFGIGRMGQAAVNAGVRFAQFSSRANMTFNSDPDWHFAYMTLFGGGHAIKSQAYHSNAASFDIANSFHGIGPSLSWAASTRLSGDGGDERGIAMDWGLNVAVLFGRQKVKSFHRSTGYFNRAAGALAKYVIPQHITYTHPPVSSERQRSVIVPNVGGFAGFSVQYTNAKISLGYRADFFFGPMDGGIDTRKSYNQSFYGPYATISIGLGG